MNHPYTQQANKIVSEQVSSLDAEVSHRWLRLSGSIG